VESFFIPHTDVCFNEKYFQNKDAIFFFFDQQETFFAKMQNRIFSVKNIQQAIRKHTL